MDPEVVPPDSTLRTLVYGSVLYRWSCRVRTKGTWTHFNALLFALDRQRKEKQDLKASKKFFKNRHELYADELVGCWAIRIILYHRAALQAFESMLSCMFDPPPPRSVWPLARTQNWWTTWSQRESSFWPSTFSTQMSLRRCGIAIAVPSTMLRSFLMSLSHRSSTSSGLTQLCWWWAPTPWQSSGTLSAASVTCRCAESSATIRTRLPRS